MKIQPGRGKVNPETLDNDRKTPPSYAAQGEHGGVVKILLGLEEVSPHKPNKWGRTQLSGVLERGCEGAVKILHPREEADPDMPDSYGETQLPYVAQNRRLRAVAALQPCQAGVTPSTIQGPGDPVPGNNCHPFLFRARYSWRCTRTPIFVGWGNYVGRHAHTRTQIKDPEEVTNKMYGLQHRYVSRSLFPDL